MEKLYQIYLQHPQICTDTRKITPGCLFFCLKGENFDGNRFAKQAAESGAACVVTEDESLRNDDRFFVVSDVLETLQQLAKHHRAQLSIPVVGITGTNGKTTTKELISTVLQVKYKISFTQGNLNNHIGVPLTLLSIPVDTEIAIVEMGANHVGEIADLCRLSQPTFGLITNIGTAHIEGFGSRENIVLTKRALYDAVMSRDGILFVNGGDPTLVACAGNYSKQVLYGDCAASHCRGEIVEMNPYLSVRVNGVTFQTHLTGEYNLANIVGAMMVGAHFGISTEEAAAAISAYQPTNNRSQVGQVGSNTVISDFYNANPTSMMAALHNLCHLQHAHKVAILGDMLELGSVSHEEHLAVVHFCQENDIDAIFVGSNFKALNLQNITVFENVDMLNMHLAAHPIENAMVLIKGSRGIHLEKTQLI